MHLLSLLAYAILIVWSLSAVGFLVALAIIFVRAALAKLMFAMRHRPDAPPTTLKGSYQTLGAILQQSTSQGEPHA